MSDIINFYDYTYFINWVCDGFPAVNPLIISEICTTIKDKYDFENVDKIVCIEAMGIPIAVLLSLYTNTPYVVIRKRKYGLHEEIEVVKSTGYEESKLYINDIEPYENVFIVDDLISTGGTLTKVIQALRNKDVYIQDVVCVIGKNKGKYVVEKETGIPVDTLVTVGIDEFDKIIVERNI